jgi:coenzyme F420-dependent glucose-6-phosphate dehydrogenase
MTVRIGYKASAEQFGPRELLDFSLLAEEHGMDLVAVSDHFQPWRHNGGHGPAAVPWLAALGQASSRVALGTSVLTPTLRYHPSMVAQAFATLGMLSPARLFLGVGSGEAMNETPATGQQFPGRKERRMRLAEAVELIRLLWQEERLDFKGDYYEVARATIYDRPEQSIPIFIAASGPLAAELAGRTGDGFICTSGKDPALYRTLLDAVVKGAMAAGRDPSAVRRMIEVKVSYDRDPAGAQQACSWWAALALTPEQKEGIDDPLEMERVADENAHGAHTRFIVSSDPDQVIEQIGAYLDLGFDDLVLHAPGADQARFITQFSEDVMPALRSRAEFARLRYLTELMAWMGGHSSWSEAMIAEQVDLTDSARVSADLAQAEQAGLLERTERGLRLTELGWRVAQGMGEALQSSSAEQAEQLKAVVAGVTPALGDGGEALSVRYLAEVLVWIGGDAVWSEDVVVDSIDDGNRSRVFRDLRVAEQAGVIERQPGGIRLTDHGWRVAAGELG